MSPMGSLSTLVKARVYAVRVGDSSRTMRYVVLMTLHLGVRQFIGLVREEPSDRTFELPSLAAGNIGNGETMIWAEELLGEPEPLLQDVSRVIEDLFQERLKDYLEELYM